MITLEFKRLIKEGKKRVFKAPVESQQQVAGAKEVGSIVAVAVFALQISHLRWLLFFFWEKRSLVR